MSKEKQNNSPRPATNNATHYEASIALIGHNSLMMLGLKIILKDIMPLADYRIYPNLSNIKKDGGDTSTFFHYFIEPNVFAEAPDFFSRHLRQTIILSDGSNEQAIPRSFRKLNVMLPEDELVKQLLLTYQHAHNHYNHYPTPIATKMQREEAQTTPLLTLREQEVLTLLVKGLINKQIADHLSISVNTVITHRRNIMQKLNSQSLPKLVIYAVTHHLVSADDIK